MIEGGIGAFAISLLGLSPFLVLLAVLTVWKRDLLAATGAFLGTAVLLATLVWRILPEQLLGSTLKGMLVSLDITIIVAGALLFIDVLKKVRILSSLEHYLYRISPDTRVQALFLSWSLGALLEGAAGFGVPAIIIAPLLLHFGFSIPGAAAIALLANTVPVSFGALGTPLRIGASGYPLADIVPYAVSMGALLALVAPLLVSGLITRELPSGGRRNLEAGANRIDSTWKFALWCGASFGIPYFLVGLVAPEFPTLIGGAVSIVSTLIAAQIPTWRTFFLPASTVTIREQDPNHVPLKAWRVALPFALLIGLILILRVIPYGYTIDLPGSLTHTINLYNPGFALIMLAVGYAVIGKLSKEELQHSALLLGTKLLRTTLVVIAVVATAQILVHSGANASNLPSMINGFASFLNRETLVVMSPLVGAFGAFVAGSVTVSNLTVLPLQWETATLVGTSGILVVCLQLFGATAGNATALASISAVEGALGSKRQGRSIMLKLLRVLPVYFIAISLIAVFISIVLYAQFPELTGR